MANDRKKDWLDWANGCVSLIAACLGAFITYQNIQLSNEVDRLSENLRASSLVGDLINSLTSRDTKRDIALLALDNALGSESEVSIEEREQRHKLLIAKIAARLLDEFLARKDSEESELSSQQLLDETVVAREILTRFKEEDVSSQEDPEYQKVAKNALNDWNKEIKSPTDDAEVTHEETDRDDVLIGEVEEKTIDPQEQKRFLQAEVLSAENDKVVYLHYDDSELEDEMETLSNKLEEKNWFVPERIQQIDVNAPNCATVSSIRFFHDDDRSLAQELKTLVISSDIDDLNDSLSEEELKLIDLTNWSKASLVPEQQLELWVANQGDICRENRNKQ